MYKFLVEFIATFCFIYVSLCFINNPFVIGITYLLLVLLTMNISGGYLNPLLTIGLTYLDKKTVNEMGILLFAQILGALVGFELSMKYKI